MGREPIYRRVGNRLKAAREAKGVTQEDLAERCGVGTDYIGKIEAGGRRVQLHTLQGIVDELGVPLAALFPESRVPSRPSGAREVARAFAVSDREIDELIDGLRDLDRATIGSLAFLVRKLRAPKR
jgi:transcriptional regulator with XRE-family HTH domain